MVISDLDRFATLNAAGHYTVAKSFHIACDEVQECRLSGTVSSYDSDLLVSLEVVCEVVQIAVLVVVKTQVLAVDDLGSQACRTLHRVHVDLLLCVHLRGSVLEVIEGVDTISCLSGTGARCASDPLQFAAKDVADLVGFRIVVCYALFTLFEEVLVVASVGVDRAMIHLHDSVADSVEEVSVVGYHEESATGAAEVAFQELDGVDVQVVGRLVHDKELCF